MYTQSHVAMARTYHIHGDNNNGSYIYNGDKPKSNTQNLNSEINFSISQANQMSVIQNSFTLIYFTKN